MKITEIRAWTLEVPLRRPLVMGSLRYDSRDYVLVQVTTDDGLAGVGYGMARNAPVAEVVRRNIAPLLVAEDPLLNEDLWARMYYVNLPISQRGIYMRALSAVDVALWDLKGKMAGLPIWQLLGGARTRIPLLVAGGYPMPDRSLADLRTELVGYAERGFRMVKIAAGALEDDTERLRTAREALGSSVGLSYDAHWAWREVFRVLPTVKRWTDMELHWIEDPFPSETPHLADELRRATDIPLAIGEDLVGRWAYRDLFRQHAVDVVRVDATVTGGFTEAARICALAAAEGRPVSPHVFPDVHVHLGAAYPSVLAVELTDPAQEIEMVHRFVNGDSRIVGGEIVAPETPGLGVEIDWDAVKRFQPARERALAAV